MPRTTVGVPGSGFPRPVVGVCDVGGEGIGLLTSCGEENPFPREVREGKGGDAAGEAGRESDCTLGSCVPSLAGVTPFGSFMAFVGLLCTA